MASIPADISRALDRGLDEDASRAAVIARSGTLSYADLDAAANRGARTLAALGVGAGDRVAACLPNDLDIVIAFHAAMRLGAVWVGINQAFAVPEKAYMLGDSQTRMLLCDPATAADLAPHRGDLTDLRSIVEIDGRDAACEWREALTSQSDEPLDAHIDPHSPAAIAYTSGTTGYPKGAIHSQYNLLLPGAYLGITRRYDSSLRKGDCFPLTIINMLVLTTLLTAQAGGCAVIMDSLAARNVAAWIERERVTVWNGPPPVLYTMAHDSAIAPSDLASLREVWSGGADCPEPIRTAFESKFGVELRGTFGQTEAPTVITIEVPGADHSKGSSGVALPHLEVTIRDRSGQLLGPGEVGEICVGARAPAEIRDHLERDWGVASAFEDEPPRYRHFLGYWNRPEQTAKVLEGGVLHTGDAGSLDADRNLVVSDRLNLMLNRGGANVYPAEIERVAHGFDAVDSCAVVGVPDERLGQRVGMFVQFKPDREPDLDGLLAHCRVHLAEYKVPELVATADQLPRNAMGKIDRKALAALGQTVLAGARRRRRGSAASLPETRA